MIQSEPYSISDIFKYDKCDVDKTSKYITGSGATFVFDTDHYRFTGENTNVTILNNITDDFEASMICQTGNRNAGIGAWSEDGSKAIYLVGVSSGTGLTVLNPNWSTNRVSTLLSNNTWYKFKFIKQGNNYTGVVEDLNGNVVVTRTSSISENLSSIKFVNIYNSWIDIKEVKVKLINSS